MIYYQIEYPDMMQGQLLDDYLKKGWYRIGQKIITTDLIEKGESLIPVFWLRYNLEEYQNNKTAKKILKKNSNYLIKFKNYEVNSEIEGLFRSYIKSIDFEMTDTVIEYLQEDRPVNVFKTHLIEIRDNHRLIACGYFDTGLQSSSSILHFYHPDYKKQSLGKYLMLLTINYSLKHKMNYYYPGYISPENKKFDYKLFPDKNSAEIYLREDDEWFKKEAVYSQILPWSKLVTAHINEKLTLK